MKIKLPKKGQEVKAKWDKKRKGIYTGVWIKEKLGGKELGINVFSMILVKIKWIDVMNVSDNGTFEYWGNLIY